MICGLDTRSHSKFELLEILKEQLNNCQRKEVQSDELDSEEDTLKGIET
jgi:hypothetical protein